jgi:hypothetical protein
MPVVDVVERWLLLLLLLLLVMMMCEGCQSDLCCCLIQQVDCRIRQPPLWYVPGTTVSAMLHYVE